MCHMQIPPTMMNYFPNSKMVIDWKNQCSLRNVCKSLELACCLNKCFTNIEIPFNLIIQFQYFSTIFSLLQIWHNENLLVRAIRSATFQQAGESDCYDGTKWWGYSLYQVKWTVYADECEKWHRRIWWFIGQNVVDYRKYQNVWKRYDE